ncbi:DUF805 domain-containing protein [Xylophilus sp. Leaf220]|uniref:DUF805 domain-containing protein n=1 Tax=Xylophilus sp. Leaf220 TaxID=1735686 RepID=UPI0006FC6CC0|nr:DUF805 domain-containing protein [Xylophilus sp. Leaf220]KQM71323.1 hypothetical protein ASE76_08965 [Xylophilus sp. Leaf220]
MTFGQAVSVCLQKKYVDFSGRASRSELWWFFLFQILAYLVSGLIHNVVYMVVVLALLLPSLGVGVRRLHDVGRSGWWLLISVIPLVGGLVLLYWMVQPGDAGSNEYGAPVTAPTEFLGGPPGSV